MDPDIAAVLQLYRDCGSKWTLHFELALEVFFEGLRIRFRGQSDELLLLDWIDRNPDRRVTHKEIAAELGMTRDRAALKLKRLERDGLIRHSLNPRTYERVTDS